MQELWRILVSTYCEEDTDGIPLSQDPPQLSSQRLGNTLQLGNWEESAHPMNICLIPGHCSFSDVYSHRWSDYD